MACGCSGKSGVRSEMVDKKDVSPFTAAEHAQTLIGTVKSVTPAGASIPYVDLDLVDSVGSIKQIRLHEGYPGVIENNRNKLNVDAYVYAACEMVNPNTTPMAGNVFFILKLYDPHPFGTVPRRRTGLKQRFLSYFDTLSEAERDSATGVANGLGDIERQGNAVNAFDTIIFKALSFDVEQRVEFTSLYCSTDGGATDAGMDAGNQHVDADNGNMVRLKGSIKNRVLRTTGAYELENFLNKLNPVCYIPAMACFSNVDFLFESAKLFSNDYSITNIFCEKGGVKGLIWVNWEFTNSNVSDKNLIRVPINFSKWISTIDQAERLLHNSLSVEVIKGWCDPRCQACKAACSVAERGCLELCSSQPDSVRGICEAACRGAGGACKDDC